MDAYAWIEYLGGTSKGTRVRDTIEDSHNTCVTSMITLAEVLSKFIRKDRDPKVAMKALEDNSILQTVDVSIAMLAGELYAEFKKKEKDFGLADAFVLAAARKKPSKILTGDPHFKTVPEAVMI